MKRGDVWWTSFDPAFGSEIRNTRPAIIVSNNASNKALDRVQVIPLSSKTARVYSSEVLIDLKGRTSKAMADQIRTVAKERLREFITILTLDEIAAVERAIKIQLALHD